MGGLEDHHTKCGSVPVFCPNKCGINQLQQLLRRNLENHLKNCRNRPHSCEHCGLVGKYDDIVRVHDEVCEKKLVSCSQCALSMERGEVKKHIQTVCMFTKVHCKYHGIGCKARKRRMSISQHEEEDDKAHLHMSLEKIVKLDSTLCSSTNSFGLITFKLSEFNKKLKEDKSFYSEPFYSSPGGYEMCIIVDLNGDGDHDGTHMSVYLELSEGPDDGSLHWPFLGTGKFELLNQLADDSHYVKKTKFVTDSNMQPGKSRGFSHFISLSELPYDSANNTQYLMEDRLYFRVTVTVEEHKPWLVTTVGMTS